MAAKSPLPVVYGIEEHCDLLLHEECVLQYRQEWLVAVSDFKEAIARRKAVSEELKKVSDRKHFWRMQSQFWKGLLKVRHAALASARQKRAMQIQDAMWCEKQIRNYKRMMPGYQRGMEALEEGRKNLAADFRELRQHWAEEARIEAIAPRPQAVFEWTDGDAKPIPKYTLQV